jgi:hypothetical protein
MHCWKPGSDCKLLAATSPDVVGNSLSQPTPHMINTASNRRFIGILLSAVQDRSSCVAKGNGHMSKACPVSRWKTAAGFRNRHQTARCHHGAAVAPWIISDGCFQAQSSVEDPYEVRFWRLALRRCPTARRSCRTPDEDVGEHRHRALAVRDALREAQLRGGVRGSAGINAGRDQMRPQGTTSVGDLPPKTNLGAETHTKMNLGAETPGAETPRCGNSAVRKLRCGNSRTVATRPGLPRDPVQGGRRDNTAAVHLWQALGVPDHRHRARGVRLEEHGLVGLYVVYLSLD